MFKPELFSTLKDYNKEQFYKDLSAGVVVGIVALPLAIAFGIASGVSPDKGLVTAIIAGFLISFLGGSKVQIGGPTGAFIVIVYGVIQSYGVDGLIISTFLAGIMLIIMGLARMGSIIKFIPHPLIVGFTSGIALIIFTSQIKDILGLQIEKVPADFIDKWIIYFQNFQSVNLYDFGIAASTILILVYLPRVFSKVPASFVAIILITIIANIFNMPVETIASKFGEIPNSLPMPMLPNLDFHTIQKLISPAFTIALLAGIESLLSAVVADGMIGTRHKPNTELIAQGVANMFSSIFGGIPATGAIARTATNVKNGAKTPIAGMIHAVTLLLIMYLFGGYAKLIPLACLAGILVVVSYNMSEHKSFRAILNGPRDDRFILLLTFILTVIVDLTVAIQLGMLLSAFLFMNKMAKISNVKSQTDEYVRTQDLSPQDDPNAITKFTLPPNVDVFELEGPLFFAAVFKFKEELAVVDRDVKILILRMRFVPYIDESGVNAIRELYNYLSKHGIKLILSGVQDNVYDELKASGLVAIINIKNIKRVIDAAVARAWEITNEEVK